MHGRPLTPLGQQLRSVLVGLAARPSSAVTRAPSLARSEHANAQLRRRPATRAKSHARSIERLPRKETVQSPIAPRRTQERHVDLQTVGKETEDDCSDGDSRRSGLEKAGSYVHDRLPDDGLQSQESEVTGTGQKALQKILSTGDSMEAVDLVSERVAEKGPASMSVPFLHRLLDRDYLRPRALRTLLRHSHALLRHEPAEHRSNRDWNPNVFRLYENLLRHSRQTWPRAIPHVVALLTEFIDAEGEKIEEATQLFNRALRLVSIRIPSAPFKDNDPQTDGIVQILTFMSSQSPALQISRQGYRGVVAVQLAQAKTADEQRWADLKALSWPPWKQDRTAVDAGITAEEHGTSKALSTLSKMIEAGYRPLEWEQAARIWAGWDMDNTPTVQTRVAVGADFLSRGVLKEDAANSEKGTSEHWVWAARIETTRTVQEAWACFLAYQDEKLPLSEKVALAILKKLHEEDLRARELGNYRQRAQAHDGERPLYAGDVQEIQPLPPSTNLETYTRTAPPSLVQLYHQLYQSDPHIVSQGACLAFLVANAGSLKDGVNYLLDCHCHKPGIMGMLHLDPDADLAAVPNNILNAFFALVGRFSKVPWGTTSAEAHSTTSWGGAVLKGVELNEQIPLARAVQLLKLRRPTHRPPWTAVLRALGHESSLGNMRSVHEMQPHGVTESLTPDQEKWHGSITAYRLGLTVLNLMHDIHVDPEAETVLAFCHATENAAIGSWGILVEEEHHSSSTNGAKFRPAISEATTFLGAIRTPFSAKKLTIGFRALVGAAKPDAVAMPRLLEIPNPALLHAYVRALGWLADYMGLLNLARFMREHRADLAARASRDRNGEPMMGRVVVALRVFLERSWLDQEDVGRASEAARGTGGPEDSVACTLERLRAPAPEAVRRQVRKIVDELGQWKFWSGANGEEGAEGGEQGLSWPSDEAVRLYCSHPRFKEGFASPTSRPQPRD